VDIAFNFVLAAGPFSVGTIAGYVVAYVAVQAHWNCC